MRRFALLAALLLVPFAPAAQAGGAPSEYPPEVRALAAEWVADVETATAPYQDRPWYPEMARFLQKAKNESAAGLVRATTFDLDTTMELLTANLLVDEAASRASDAEKKTFVLERVAQIRGEADAAWERYRDHLAELDDSDSLHAIETALYSADIALGAKATLDTYDHYAREFPKVAGFPREAVLDMLRVSQTPARALQYAEDLLGVARAQEGFPPRVDEARWGAYVDASLLPREAAETGGPGETYQEVGDAARENGEALLAITVDLAAQRMARLQQIQLTYGDAESRGRDVVTEAAINMEKRLNRTSLDDVRAYGLTGVHTADATDQARFVLDFWRDDKATLPFIVAAWAALDHQEYVAVLLADVSPQRPADPATNNLGHQNNLTRYLPPKPNTRSSTPDLPIGLALGGIAVVAVLLSRAKR